MSARTFIVRVSETPPRVVVEDVRTQRRAVALDLDAVGAQIAALLRPPGEEPADGGDDSGVAGARREDCVSAHSYGDARWPPGSRRHHDQSAGDRYGELERESQMTHTINRRQALSGLGVGTLGVTVAAAAPQAADAAAPSVRGTWTIAPKTARGPAPFQAMAAFAAGGVFITTGSDEAGTGVGEWSQSGANGFAFTYVNFHFNPAGKPANTVKVRACRHVRRLAALRKGDAGPVRPRRQAPRRRRPFRIHRQAARDSGAMTLRSRRV